MLDDGSREYLATNLFDPAITKDMFKELYFQRWPAELKYKELKSRFAMEEFSGATATSIIQEFYINMLLSNLVSLIKNDADEEIDITSKSSSVICLNSQLLRSCTKKLSGAVHSSFPVDHFQEKN